MDALKNFHIAFLAVRKDLKTLTSHMGKLKILKSNLELLIWEALHRLHSFSTMDENPVCILGNATL
jgi:hypothetical protein